MKKQLIFGFLAGLLAGGLAPESSFHALSGAAWAQDDTGGIDVDKLKDIKDLKDLKGKIKDGDIKDALNKFKGKTGDLGAVGGDAGKPLSVSDLPAEDVVTEIDQNDKDYVKAHWSNAKRNYKKKNFERALEEVKNILGVDRSNAEALLMRASVAAMRKNFDDAWRDLEKARKIIPTDPKLTKFAETLEKASPKPANVGDGGFGNRAPAKYAFEAAIDAFEDLFNDRTSTSKVCGFVCGEASEADGKIAFPLTISGVEKLDPAGIEKRLKEVSKGEIKGAKEANEGKSVEMTLSMGGLPAKNADIKPLKEITEYMKTISEETDVSISKSEEGDVSADKFMTGTYTLIARRLSDINGFLRKMSPHAEHYSLEKLEITSINNKILWKGNAKIRFKTE